MKQILLILVIVLFTANNAQAVVINEVREHYTGTSYGDFIELKGTPGESLSDTQFITIYPDGEVRLVVDLDGHSFAADSNYYVLARTTSYRQAPNDILWGSHYLRTWPSYTHLLVNGFSGSEGVDLDTNDDGIIDSPPWTNILDSISFVGSNGTGSGQYYSSTTVGPSANALGPYHFWRNLDSGTWLFSEDYFSDDESDVADTPRAENAWAIAAGATGVGSFLGGRFVVTITSSSTTKQLTLKVSEISGDPGGAITALAVLAPDATSLTPDIVSEDTYWVMTENFNPGSDVTYTISIDATGETGIQNPDKVVIMKRSDSGSNWVPYSTTRVGSIYTTVITDGFSEFALGSNSAFNTLPAGLDYFMVD